ncbi:MAG: hypothetical protein U0183_01825 [Polyangiaceae bacterium]|jgi:hypothetical protein
MKRTVIVPALVAALLAGATAVGCDEAEKVLGGEGAACESILDCQAELSCVATSASTRTCKRVASPSPPLPAEDAAADAENDGDTDAEVDASPPDAEPADAAETGTPDASDAGDAADGRG